MGKKVVRYSEAFKLKVVSELESGKLSSVAEARRKYDIARIFHKPQTLIVLKAIAAKVNRKVTGRFITTGCF